MVIFSAYYSCSDIKRVYILLLFELHASFQYKEYEEDLNSALKFDTSHLSDETALEEELAALLTEDTGSPPAKKMVRFCLSNEIQI